MIRNGKERARWLIVAVVAAAILGASFLFQHLADLPQGDGIPTAVTSPGAVPQRIISLAPSITESLFALGLGDKVVGVTRYCDYPPEATARQAVGGYFDPNYEAMTALRPDLVVMLPEHQKPRNYLTQRGIEVLTVDHGTVDGILVSLQRIGDACAVPERAEALVQSIQQRVADVTEKTRGLEPPSVMIAVGRDISTGKIEKVYIAGDGTWYEELIDLAGGVNAYSGDLATPTVSAEGIISMDPDVIVEILGNTTSPDFDPERLVNDWDALPGVTAVQQERVFLFADDFAVIPGPRFVLILEKLARVLHPRLSWDEPPQVGRRKEGM